MWGLTYPFTFAAMCGAVELNGPLEELTLESKYSSVTVKFPLNISAEQEKSLPIATGKHEYSLSLNEAVGIALLNNTDIQFASYLPSIAVEGLKASMAVYSPTLFEKNNLARTNRPIQSTLDNGTVADEVFREHRWDFQAGVKKALPTGGGLSLYTEVDRLNSSSTLTTPNPQNTSRLTAELHQSLLQGFGDQANKASIETANINIAISNEELKTAFSNVVRDVAVAYWQLVFFDKSLMIVKESLAKAEEVHRKETVRIDQGLANLTELDRAIAAVEDRKKDVIVITNQLNSVMGQLKFLIGMADNIYSHQTRIKPVEDFAPPEKEIVLNREELLNEAFKDHPELLVANKKLDIADIKRKLAKHLKLPRLEAKASYTLNAIGENFDEAFDGTYISDRKSWGLGLEFEWPLGGEKASAEYTQTLFQYERARAEVKQITERIIYQVNTLANDIEAAHNEIEVCKLSLDAARRVLAREESRYDLGKMSNQDLLRDQEHVYNAEREYKRAIVNLYIKRVELHRVTGSLDTAYGIKIKPPVNTDS